MSQVCPYCRCETNSKADMQKHILVFHPNLTEEERLKKIRENPVQFVVEHGFSRELNLVRQGKCPICEQPVKSEELMGAKEWKEFQISGFCGPCQRQRAVKGF